MHKIGQPYSICGYWKECTLLGYCVKCTTEENALDARKNCGYFYSRFIKEDPIVIAGYSLQVAGLSEEETEKILEKGDISHREIFNKIRRL
jgi:hypothetical protein